MPSMQAVLLMQCKVQKQVGMVPKPVEWPKHDGGAASLD